MAITATFLPGVGLLSVFGDSLGNTVTFSRNAAGTILINGGAVPVIGGTPTVANTSRIQAFGLNDDDVITLDESFGALPAATLFGGTATISSRADRATTCCSARPATTSCSAAAASTCCSAALTTTS